MIPDLVRWEQARGTPFRQDELDFVESQTAVTCWLKTLADLRTQLVWAFLAGARLEVITSTARAIRVATTELRKAMEAEMRLLAERFDQHKWFNDLFGG